MRLGKPGFLILEIFGVLVALAAALAVFLLWRLQSGPLSLSVFKSSAEFAIERSLPGDQEVEIEAASISRNRTDGGLNLLLSGVIIDGEAAQSSIQLESVAANFHLIDLIKGKVGPRRLAIDEPTLRFVRRTDKTIDFGYGKSAQPSGSAGLDFLTGGRYFGRAFQRAELNQAKIEFFDETSGASWWAENATASLEKNRQGYTATASGDFKIEDEDASLALSADYSELEEIISADLTVDNAPVSDILEMFFGSQANILRAPITGDASIKFAKDGEVLSSELKATAGQGHLILAGVMSALDHVAFSAAFDPIQNHFSIEHLDFDAAFGSGTISGDIGLQLQEDARSPAHVSFDLSGSALEVTVADFFSTALQVANARASGIYGLDRRRLVVDAAHLDLLDVEINGAGAIEFPRSEAGNSVSPSVVAEFKVDGDLDPQRILMLWPTTLALGARDFIEERIPLGVASDIAFAMDLDAGAVGELGHLPDDAMKLSFTVADATAIYAPGMTPLTNVRGRGVLSGNSFFLTADEARVGDIEITDGEVDMPALAPRGQLSFFRFTAKGDARNIMTVLNQRPLEILKYTNLTPDQFSGSGDMRVQVSRPNRREVSRERYGYSGAAKFSDLSIEEFYGDIAISNAVGDVDLSTQSMTITGDAEIAGTPIELDWTQKFYGKGDRTQIKVTGEVDSSTGDIFGVPSRQVLRGPIAFEAVAKGNLGDFRLLDINTDLTAAVVTLDGVNWRKPQDLKAVGRFNFDLTNSEETAVTSAIEGDGVDIRAAAAFGPSGRIENADIQRLFLEGAADISADVRRDDAGALDLTVTGPLLNIGAAIERMIIGGEDEPSSNALELGDADLRVTSRIDELVLREQETYRDASFDLRRDDGRIEAFDFSAVAQSGKPVSMSLKRTGEEIGPTQAVVARTDDIGSLLRGVFGLRSVVGGQGVLEMMVTPREMESLTTEHGLKGKLEARNIRVRGAPLLTRIFSAGSLEGLSDLLNGEGIELSRAFADFSFRDNLFKLTDAHAAGPSVGLSAEGEVDLGAGGDISLSGAVAPAYQINSLLGKAPIVGDIFVNREGEGVVALSYDVSGPVTEPAVTVNPLSALTPGFLRRVFEIDRVAPPEAAPAAENPPDATTQ